MIGNRFRIEKTLALPVMVESHVIARVWMGELWLLINQPGHKRSQFLKVTRSHKIQVINSLPVVSAFAIGCNKQMVITGADADGRPIVLGIDQKGKTIWKYSFSDLTPVSWPLASCVKGVMVAWQQVPEKIETGLLDTRSATLLFKDSIAIQARLPRIFAFKDKLFAAWSGKTGIHVINLTNKHEQVLLSDRGHTDAFSIGECKDGIYFGSRKGNHAYWLLPPTKLPCRIDLGNIIDGTFNLVSGGDPLIWIQRPAYGIDGDLQWTSNLFSQKRSPFTIEGYVYAVLWWNQILVTVNQSKLFFLIDHDH